jgi:hypothetical protein
LSKCSARQAGELGAGIEGVADRQALRGRDEPLHERVVDAGADEEPRAGQTDLAGIAEDRLDGPVHGVVQRGVVEDDVGALAAELE